MDKKSLKCSERWHQQLHDNWETRPIILMLMLVQLLSGLAQNIFLSFKVKMTLFHAWQKSSQRVYNRLFLSWKCLDCQQQRVSVVPGGRTQRKRERLYDWTDQKYVLFPTAAKKAAQQHSSPWFPIVDTP